MSPPSPLPRASAGPAVDRRRRGRGGRFAALRARLRRPSRRTLLGAALVAVLAPPLLFLLADRVFPFPFERFARPTATLVTAADGTPLRLLIAPDDRWRLPIPLAELPPELPKLLVAAEDRRFGRHPGVDPVALARATWTNLRAGRVVSGGSTLAMQLARMTDPRPRRLRAKLVEAFRALQITLHTTPRRRLEAYFALAPYGRNVEGIGAASWLLFGKRPASLSLGEMALLVALPRAPNAFDPVRHPEAAMRARDGVLDRLERAGVVAPRDAEDARRQPLPRGWRRPPLLAPHLALRAAAQRRGAPRVVTTLDAELQRRAEELVRRRVGELRRTGIGNAAAVVIDRADRGVRAYVGSADFFEREHQGQVDGAAAIRSPGSALKPFLYALAYDRGVAVPQSYLLDIPTDFGGYVTENYDGTYRGRVTAEEALVHSLNASTVRLLAQVGVGDFLGLLRAGGLATLDPRPERTGLPLVLGAGEVRLVDLVDLYATLADGGVHRPARFLADDPAIAPAAGQRLLSTEASVLVARTLTELRRPDLPGSWELAQGAPKVAWKTGTSYGHRDAWAVGFSGRYAIGVWVGNFDGRGRLGLSGADHAGPLLFDLFRAADPGGAWREPTAVRIESVEVCAASHQLPGPGCTVRDRVDYLPGRTRLVPCPVHALAWVDAKTGERLTGDCLADHPHRQVVIEQQPPELVAWWRAQGEPVPSLPRWSADCRGVPSEDPPKIVSPDPRTPYRLRSDAPLEYQRVALTARGALGAEPLFWYQDGVLVARSGPGEARFLPLAAGTHKLVVVDSLGRSDSVAYKVERPGS